MNLCWFTDGAEERRYDNNLNSDGTMYKLHGK